MEIAVLGWGSLIWCPGSLKIKTRWRADGVALPIEFARISSDGRLTLVIRPGSDSQPTYWALSEFGNLEDARQNLKRREHTPLKNIHYMTAAGEVAEGIPECVGAKIKKWLVERANLGAVIWTGLCSNWQEKRNREFSEEEAVRYLEEVEEAKNQAKATYHRAKEYVRNTPNRVQTAVRRKMREKGWEDADLPRILFEP